jgi:hypothetical protein
LKKTINIQNLHQKLSSTYQFDLRAFALFRMVFGLVMLIDLSIRLSDFKTFYTNQGVLPLEYFSKYFSKYYFIHIYQINDAPWFVGICFTLQIIAVLCFAIGYRTKLFQVILLLFYISLHMRNPYLLQGGDDLLRVMLLFSLFMPLNAVWAVQTKAVKYNFVIPTLVFMFQILMVYWVSALMKTSPEWHGEGTALYYAFNLDCIQWPLAKYLLQFPALHQFLTPLVFYLEMIVPLLFFIPFKNNVFRVIGISVLILFQIGIASTLFVGLFYLINLTALIPLLPSSFFNYFKMKEYPSVWSLQADQFTNYFVGFLLVYVLFWNTNYIPQFKYGLAKRFKSFGFATGLNQNWGMFAPNVFKEDGWLIYEAITNQNDTIDLKNNNQKVRYEKPENILKTVKNDRWRKYTEYLIMPDRAWLREPFHNYIFNQNKDLELKQLNIIYMKEITPAPGEKDTITKVNLNN